MRRKLLGLAAVFKLLQNKIMSWQSLVSTFVLLAVADPEGGPGGPWPPPNDENSVCKN